MLQGEFKILAKPMQALLQPNIIGAIMSTCLICHNMNVEDWIMEEDAERRYDPKNCLVDSLSHTTTTTVDSRPTVENKPTTKS